MELISVQSYFAEIGIGKKKTFKEAKNCQKLQTLANFGKLATKCCKLAEKEKIAETLQKNWGEIEKRGKQFPTVSL